MNQEIQNYIENYPSKIQTLFIELRELIIQSVPNEIEEKLWAKLPSFYIGKNFVRIIPFKDHINIEADAIMKHTKQLEQFKITPKGMLQIYLNQEIPDETLVTIFSETLLGES
jgi:hypothetical protein